MVTTSQVVGASDDLRNAMQHGEISLDQAAEIASAEESAPGSARELVAVAKKSSFHVFKEEARRTELEAEQHLGLAERQHAARSSRSHADALGMVYIHLALEPHVGSPITARAEAEAQRLYRKAKVAGEREPFEHHLADAYGALLSGAVRAARDDPNLSSWSVMRWRSEDGRPSRRVRSARSRASDRWRRRSRKRSLAMRSSPACSTTARTYGRCVVGRAPCRSRWHWRSSLGLLRT